MKTSSEGKYLEALLATELEERERNTVAWRIKDAHLPRMKSLDEFDFSKAPPIQATKIHELAQGGYIERAEPIILIGDCGTGKTHLLTGLCVAACKQKRRVRFATAAALVRVGSSRTTHLPGSRLRPVERPPEVRSLEESARRETADRHRKS